MTRTDTSHAPVGAATLIDIRDILRRAGHAPPPWSTPREAVERLYDLLRLRRDDEAFWSALRDLANRLADRRFVQTAIPGGQALDEAACGEILAELRASLPPADNEPRPLAEWTRARASAKALLGFLLLGAAIGCWESGEVCRSTAEEHGLSGEEAVVYDALADIVREADLTDREKCTLYECLPELGAVHREYLLEWLQNPSNENEIEKEFMKWIRLCEEMDDNDEEECDDGNCH